MGPLPQWRAHIDVRVEQTLYMYMYTKQFINVTIAASAQYVIVIVNDREL